MVRSSIGLGLGKRSLEKLGWVESMEGAAVILSYQHYNQKRKKMVKGKMGRGTMGKDNMGKAKAKAGRVEHQKGKEQRVNDNREQEGGKYREDVFGDTLPGSILDVLFPRHFDFIIRIPHIRVAEHQYRITNNEDLIMSVPQSGVGSIVFLREEFEETINRALFFW